MQTILMIHNRKIFILSFFEEDNFEYKTICNIQIKETTDKTITAENTKIHKVSKSL